MSSSPPILCAGSVPSSSLLLQYHLSPSALRANDSALRATKSRTLVAGLPVLASTSCGARGKHTAALEDFGTARDFNVKLLPAEATDPQAQHDLAWTHNNLGLLLTTLGRDTEALEEYRQAHELLRQVVQAKPA